MVNSIEFDLFKIFNIIIYFLFKMVVYSFIRSFTQLSVHPFQWANGIVHFLDHLLKRKKNSNTRFLSKRIIQKRMPWGNFFQVYFYLFDYLSFLFSTLNTIPAFHCMFSLIIESFVFCSSHSSIYDDFFGFWFISNKVSVCSTRIRTR